MRLDTQKLRKGWEVLQLKNPGKENGSIFGVSLLPSTDADDSLEFLVLGGAIGDATCLNRTCIMKTSISNFSESTF